MLSIEQMQANEALFISLLRKTCREGVESVVSHLQEGGFFKAPASVHHHNNFEGGLAKHSLDVYEEAMELYHDFTAKLPYMATVLNEESITVCSLLHDVCKMDVFCMRDGEPHGTGIPNNPHGFKSLKWLQEWGLFMTEAEEIAIAWHMGRWTKDAGCDPQEVEPLYMAAQRKTPLVSIIRRADSLASRKAIEEQMIDE